MCGRYFFDLESNELKKYHDQAETKVADKDIRLATNEVFPSNHVVTLGLNKEAEVVPDITRWGFEGFKKGQLMINARSETVEEKKTFSKAFRESRCIFPMSGFYEWDHNKQKFLFKGKENSTLFVGGFYRIHKTESGFETESIILTTKPNTSVASVHDRMPVIIERSSINEWLNNLEFARKHVTNDMPELECTMVEKK
ncbi:SOS response-associated peptidase [Enterococcus mundtii]|uniref:Abasic site processing protein n=1 Tax=Enterococcus mundtii TaxID=53346 RepID=A0ABQ0VGP8_ENTMU|nr:SOS response-associated peptidase family protein [Enterococcus mundtii]MZU11396.1 SOS response-associated peptidase [Bifidobacterium longum]GEN18534.1 DUF159 family protein [Ligilactobacillus acidipiscis]AUB54482.1 DUF159 family protein [Enterococcus mundtii]MZZ60017.1 SOS response-associated peptidase [Enterococcus mundtii]MZZ63021.1 SOS response-associated peptidase [Enterococcus mundtii]